MLGARIAALRQHAGMSQQALAQRLRVSSSAVGMYEQGRRTPPAEMLVALSHIFGVSTDFLLTGTPTQPDFAAVRALFSAAARHMDGSIRLRSSDGTVRNLGAEELALLFAALLTDTTEI